jgi:hypothetical protein
MAKYKISGVWKNSDNVITHYAFHLVGSTSTSRATKVIKSEAVEILSKAENSAFTWIWSYANTIWKNGEEVNVVNGSKGKYLRSNPDNTKTDNLSHLLDYDWIKS